MFLILRGCFACVMHIKSPKTAFLYAFLCFGKLKKPYPSKNFSKSGILLWASSLPSS